METILEEGADTTVAAKQGAIALWNPTAAVLWSLLLSPMIGAWLLKRNWTLLGHADKARQAHHWLVGMIFLHAAHFGWAVGTIVWELDLNLPWWTGTAVWGVWAVLAGYPQISHVDEHHGETYPRRSFAAPLLTMFAILCVASLVPLTVAGYKVATGA